MAIAADPKLANPTHVSLLPLANNFCTKIRATYTRTQLSESSGVFWT